MTKDISNDDAAGAGKRAQNIAYLIRALNQEHPTQEHNDTMDCPDVEPLLHEYLHAAWRGEETQPQWARVTRHLEICPSCARQYQELAELVDFSLTTEELEPIPVTEPDMAALHRAYEEGQATSAFQPVQELIWRVDQLGRLVMDLSQWVFGGSTSPQLGAAMLRSEGTRGDESARKHVDRLAGVKISTWDEMVDQQYTLHFNVVIQGRGPLELAGSRVLLRRGDEIVAENFTDAFGNTWISGIERDEADQLHIEILPISVIGDS